MRSREVKRLYQPIWTPEGEATRYPYQRPSAERYEPIRELAAKFNRPFSVLDIGANYAYFDCRLMQDFNCCCVMIDNKLTFPVLQANGVLDRSTIIHSHPSAATLESLAKSEHFDIVLGLAVLHHFDDPPRAYEAMRRLGWWTVFEIPGDDDLGAANPAKHDAIRECFSEESPNGYFPSHVSESKRPYYILENEPYIFEQTMDAADRDAPIYSDYAVQCDFDQSLFIKSSDQETATRPFVPGMNLWNFMRLKGVWPTQDQIDNSLALHKDHPDFHPWNFVLGFGLNPIDEEDKFERQS